MKYTITMNTPLMSHIHLRDLIEDRRKIKAMWMKSSNSLSPRENKVYSALIIDLDYQIETLRDALKGSEGFIQASCN